MINELKDPRKTFGEAIIEAAAINPNIVVLSADSSSGSGLGDFPKKFPDRHFEFGIMEQGVIGFAAGLQQRERFLSLQPLLLLLLHVPMKCSGMISGI